jgi:hypothetical protein
LSEPAVDHEDIYWLERRPSEGGRTALVRLEQNGAQTDALKADFTVRTRVHEYGGGAYAVHAGHIWFVNDGDRAIYHQPPNGPARRLTGSSPRLYADLQVDTRRRHLVGVCEDHGADPAIASLVAIAWEDGAETTLARGRDFYASPRLSPNCGEIAWLCWDNPLMPWDGAECWLAALDSAGLPVEARRIAGGEDESVFQPIFACWRAALGIGSQ